jgi:uncharacterized protein
MACRFKSGIFFFLFLLLIIRPVFAESKPTPTIPWQEWSAELFQKAQEQKKFVLLDLKAVWCHWCHVMDETTYQDPKVVELINAKYLPVKVDQDANPDLSNRYEDYGWPATIVFDSEGKEIVKRRGYIPPLVMASLLQAIIDDPTPGPSVLPEVEINPSENAFLHADQIKQLKELHLALYDMENGGWGNIHKLIDSDEWEYALTQAQQGDQRESAMAERTADQALNLLDSNWGGFYQYSDEADWKSPHYEKIMQIQSQYMRIYSLAYAEWTKPEYLQAAELTAQYIKNFLTSPEGSFYTSQDADVTPALTGAAFYPLADAERRKLGMPRIDQHVYARENGWMISGLTFLYNVTAKKEYLDQAKQAARAIIKYRALPDGGFSHDAQDQAGPFLGDTLAMAQAFLNLYASSAERDWLVEAQKSMEFIQKNFKNEDAGFNTSKFERASMGVFQKEVRQIDENITLVRTANLLSRYTGNKQHRALAEHAMRFLASPELIKKRRFLAGILLANQEIVNEPAHITIVAQKENDNALKLYQAGLKYPLAYKRIEWWDKREGALPNPDVNYPELEKPAAFACANQICSLPIFSPEKIAVQVDRLRHKQNPSDEK